MYFVYAITSEKEKRVYVGLTKDLEQRIKEHNAGKTTSTKGYRPWRIFYFEKVNNLKENPNVSIGIYTPMDAGKVQGMQITAF